MPGRRGRKPTQKPSAVSAAGSYTSKKGVRGRRTPARTTALSDVQSAAKAKPEQSGSLVDQAKDAASSYLTPDIDAAKEKFDYRKSAQERASSAANAMAINEASKSQRVSSRKKSRANELAKVHGRSDEEKIKSQAVSARNSKVLRDAALTVAPGGAASAALTKVGYAKKGLGVAKTLAKGASKLGKGSIKKGLTTGAKALASRAQKAGAKKIAKASLAKGVKLAKYKGKLAAQGELNKAASKA